MILCFDRVEFKVDELRNTAHKGEDFAHTPGHDAQGSEEIHDCV